MDSSSNIARRRWRPLICLGLSGAALWWILRRIDSPALIAALQHLQPGWFLLAALSFGASLALSAVRWHYVLRLLRLDVHSTATVRTVFIGHFFNTLFLGPAGGDLAKSALYARWFGFALPEIIASSVADRLAGGVGNILFIALAITLSSSAGIFSKLHWGPISIFKTSLLAAAIMVAAAAAHWLRSRHGDALGLNLFLRRLRFLASQLRSKPKLCLASVISSFFAQVAYNAALALCLRAVFHHPLSWLTLAWTLPLISLVSGLPISVAGAGVRDASAILLFGMYGISSSDAVASSLLMLGIVSLWAIVGGALLWKEEEETARAHAPPGVAPPAISVVIPTLNEELALPQTLRQLRQIPEFTEIIVVDGGSSDRTAKIARHAGASVLTAPRGRGQQLRAGSAAASGDVILMLHADTWLSAGAGQALLHALRDQTVAGGGFWKRFDRPHLLMRGSRFRCLLRLWIFRRVLGDQAIFVRRHILEKIGGIPAVPLMEEFELCRLLRRHGRLALASDTVVTSPRRFEKRGVIRTYARMALVTFLYQLGIPLQQLQKLYEE